MVYDVRLKSTQTYIEQQQQRKYSIRTAEEDDNTEEEKKLFIPGFELANSSASQGVSASVTPRYLYHILVLYYTTVQVLYLCCCEFLSPCNYTMYLGCDIRNVSIPQRLILQEDVPHAGIICDAET